MGFYVPLKNFSLIWRRHHYRWRASNFDLCLAFMAIDQWEFFIVAHVLWHGASVYNGHLRDTHTYWRVFCSGAVTTCFYGLSLPRLGFENPTFRLRDSDLMFTCVFYMFPICSTNVDFDEDTFDAIVFAVQLRLHLSLRERKTALWNVMINILTKFKNR